MKKIIRVAAPLLLLLGMVLFPSPGLMWELYNCQSPLLGPYLSPETGEAMLYYDKACGKDPVSLVEWDARWDDREDYLKERAGL